MKPSNVVLFASAGIAAAAGLTWLASQARARRVAGEKSLTAVPHVDLTAFMGRWTELYRIPNRFEKGCVKATAEYGRNMDGSICVVNTCYEHDGSERTKIGRAWITEPETGSKLKVGFFKIGSWYPEMAQGDYWIIDLGPKDVDERHGWVVIGEPMRRYGWIMARGATLSDEVIEGIFARLETKGYKREQFYKIGERVFKSKPGAISFEDHARHHQTLLPTIQ